MLTTAVLVCISFYYYTVTSPRFLVLFKEVLLQAFKPALTSITQVQGTALSLFDHKTKKEIGELCY